MSGHTPGPWKLERDNERERYFVTAQGKFAPYGIASVPFGFNEPFESQQHANAKVIEAAPDLAVALRALLFQSLQSHATFERDVAVVNARAALAKAGV
jgi:hypothetical protein